MIIRAIVILLLMTGCGEPKPPPVDDLLEDAIYLQRVTKECDDLLKQNLTNSLCKRVERAQELVKECEVLSTQGLTKSYCRKIDEAQDELINSSYHSCVKRKRKRLEDELSANYALNFTSSEQARKMAVKDCFYLHK